MRLDAEALDECCEELKGHKSWAYVDAYGVMEIKKLVKQGTVVVFFEDDRYKDEDGAE